MDYDDLFPWEVPHIFNEVNKPSRLPWKTFYWAAYSTHLNEVGQTPILFDTIALNDYPTEVTLRHRCMGACAHNADEIGVPWDPFNVHLMIVPVRNEPKPGNL